MADEPTVPERPEPGSPGPELRRRLRPPRQRLTIDINKMRDRIGMVETALYLIVGVFLVAAGGLILFDTAHGFVNGVSDHESAGELGLRVLDRVLLLLIVAELLFTLQLVSHVGRSPPSRFSSSGSSRSSGASWSSRRRSRSSRRTAAH